MVKVSDSFLLLPQSMHWLKGHFKYSNTSVKKLRKKRPVFNTIYVCTERITEKTKNWSNCLPLHAPFTMPFFGSLGLRRSDNSQLIYFPSLKKYKGWL